MNPQISIIFAAWNAESFMERSLDSILRQTFSDWELILVDDGSMDGTGPIADKYAAADSRIKVIHIPHGGLATARQTGLDAATGIFSIFADADDWLEDDMLELMYSKACATSSDVVFCDYVEENGLGSFYRRQEPAGNNSRDVLPQMLGQQMHGSLCTKLIRRSLYGEYGVRFVPGLSFCDDECVVIPIFSHGVPVSYVGKGLYHYDKNVNQTSDSNVWKRRTAAEYQTYLDRIGSYYQDSDLIGIYRNRVAHLVYRLTYAPVERYKENREFYRRHRVDLKASGLPASRKLFCVLYYNGFSFLSRMREI